MTTTGEGPQQHYYLRYPIGEDLSAGVAAAFLFSTLVPAARREQRKGVRVVPTASVFAALFSVALAKHKITNDDKDGTLWGPHHQEGATQNLFI